MVLLTASSAVRFQQERHVKLKGKIAHWIRSIKSDILVLWIAARDPRTPLVSKFVAAAVAAYALSPVDLVPDFIPLFGYLDDVILVPLGTWLTLKLIPQHLLEDYRALAALIVSRPTSRAGLVAIVIIWLSMVFLIAWVAEPHLRQREFPD